MGFNCSGMTASVVKWVLVIANTVFVLGGIAIIVLGAIALKNFSHYKDSGIDLSWIAIAVIVIGSIVFIIALLGCCGAIQEQRCLLITYGIISLIILITGVALGVWVLTTSETGETLLPKDKMKKLFDEKYNNSKQIRQLFDTLQVTFGCCGVNGPMDYNDLVPSSEIPPSCCLSVSDALENPNETCSHSELNKTGCYTKVTYFLGNFIQKFGMIILSLGLFNVLAITFAFCLAGHYKAY